MINVILKTFHLMRVYKQKKLCKIECATTNDDNDNNNDDEDGNDTSYLRNASHVRPKKNCIHLSHLS